MKNKIAIIQFEGVHEEVLPSYIYYLNALGIAPSVFVNERCVKRRGNIFNCLHGQLDFSYKYVPLEIKSDWINLREMLLAEKFEALMAGTFQFDIVGKFIIEIALPFVGVVHNPKIFFTQQKCVEATTKLPSILLTLGRHVTSYMILQNRQLLDRVKTISPGYWGSMDASDIKWNDGKKIFAVPGSVNFKTRNFSLLTAICEELKNDKNYHDIKFCILGGGLDRAELERQFSELGNAQMFELAKVDQTSGFVLYEEYFKQLRKANFLLPLFPSEFGDYRHNKISSVMSTAVGFALPLLQDQWTEEVYRLPGLQYSNSSLAPSVRRALMLSRDEYMNLRTKYAKLRLDELQKSIGEIENSIKFLGIDC